MDILQRIARQPAKLLAAVQALVGLALVMGWIQAANIEQVMGAVLLALSAVLAAISEYVTPVSSPVLAIGTVVNEATDSKPTGVVVDVTDPRIQP